MAKTGGKVVRGADSIRLTLTGAETEAARACVLAAIQAGGAGSALLSLVGKLDAKIVEGTVRAGAGIGATKVAPRGRAGEILARLFAGEEVGEEVGEEYYRLTGERL